MNKYAHLGGAMALVALMSLASAPAHAGNGKDALKLMPADTALVLSVNSRSLGKSKMAKDAFATLSQSGDVSSMQTKLLKDAGVDITKDIDTAVIGIAGNVEKSERVVMVIEGRFDQVKLVKFFKSEGKSFAKKQHGAMTYYVVDDDNEFAFLGNYFVATPKGGITDVLDRHLGQGKSAQKNRALMRLIKNSHTKKQIWMAMVMTPSMRKEIAAEAGGHSINTAIVGINMGKNLDMSMRLGASDGKAASAMAAALRAKVAEMAKEPSMSLVGLTDTFKNMTVKSTGKNVDASLSVSGNSVQQILGILQGML